MFITVEGPNGVGKTSIIDKVVDELAERNLEVVRTKEPTKSYLGRFLKKAEEKYSKNCLACIAAADRYFHLESIIIPAINSGKIVISDRYVESSLVLQRLDGCDLDFIWNLNSLVLVPDLSIILIASPDIINKRLLSRKKNLSRFEHTKSRASEISFYREAVGFIAQKKFNVLILENMDDMLDNNTKKIIKKIDTLIKKKGVL